MLSQESILEANKEAEDRAQEENTQPFIAQCNRDINVRNAPFIGNYIPKGFIKTQNLYFVDNSGFGTPGEPALTFNQFLDKVKEGYGYAIVECGQFQIYIQEFKEI